MLSRGAAAVPVNGPPLNRADPHPDIAPAGSGASDGKRTRRARVALLTPWHPEPVDNGSKVRLRAEIEALSQEYDIVLISLLEPAVRLDGPPQTVPGVWRQFWMPLPVYAPRSLRALAASVSPIPRSMVATWSEELAHAIQVVVDTLSVDLVIAADLRVMRYACALGTSTPVILDEANLSPFVWQQGGKQSWRSRMRQRKYRTLFGMLDGRAGTAVVCSEFEAAQFRELTDSERVRVVENGVRHMPDWTWQPPQTSRLLYTGALTYAANAEAIEFFVRDIMPHIEKSEADAELYVTGDLPARVPKGTRHPRVHLTGRLDTLDEIYRQSRVVVIPLRSGFGTRIKILEALALGLPVVTTSKGVEGLDLLDGEHLLIEDDPRAFAAAVVRLLGDSALSQELGLNGRKLVAERYTWEMQGPHLREIVAGLIATPR